jgi:hypothetical protein
MTGWVGDRRTRPTASNNFYIYGDLLFRAASHNIKDDLNNRTFWTVSNAGALTINAIDNGITLTYNTNARVTCSSTGVQIGGTAGDFNVYSNTLFVDRVDTRVGIGTNDPKFKLHGTVSTCVGVLNAAPTDTDIGNGQCVIWVDQTGNTLTFRVRYSDGTLKTGTVALT